MSLFEKRLHLSRSILLVMLALFVFAQFLPWFEEEMAIWANWPVVGRTLLETISGRFGNDLIVASLFIGVTAVVVTVPWLTGILCRAGALLWVLRFLFIGFGGYLIYYYHEHFWLSPLAASYSAGMPFSAGSGFYYVLSSVWMGVLGLFVIPRGPREMPVRIEPLEES